MHTFKFAVKHLEGYQQPTNLDKAAKEFRQATGYNCDRASLKFNGFFYLVDNRLMTEIYGSATHGSSLWRKFRELRLEPELTPEMRAKATIRISQASSDVTRLAKQNNLANESGNMGDTLRAK